MRHPRQILCGSLLIALAVGCGPESSPRRGANPPTEPIPQAQRHDEAPCRAWRLLDSGTAASFRGLSVASDDIVWASGTGGTWGRTTDGGETWVMRTVPGAEELDFRDVDAFDGQAAYLMSAGPGEASRIYKTSDGGETWELRLTNPSPRGFWDGMAFWDVDRGVLYGDPVDGRFDVLLTDDGGTSWARVPADDMPPALDGEAGFAASGSGITVAADGQAWFGTGGTGARVFRSTDFGRSWTVADTPMLAGEGSFGIFSIAFSDSGHGIVVGGDYTQPEAAERHAARSRDGGLSWELIASAPPMGYRSAVAHAPGTDGRVWITVGTLGSDLSLDGGETWAPMDPLLEEGQTQPLALNAVRFGTSTCAAWAAGPEGRLARLEPNP